MGEKVPFRERAKRGRNPGFREQVYLRPTEHKKLIEYAKKLTDKRKKENPTGNIKRVSISSVINTALDKMGVFEEREPE